MPESLFPSIITGTITSYNRPVGNVRVKVKNTSKGTEQTTLSNELGDYVVDAANFTTGYTVGDSVEVSVDDEQPVYDDNVDVSQGRIQLK